MPVTIVTLAAPKFPLGDIVVTATARSRLDPADIAQGLSRHARGDWGEVCPEDRERNEHSLEEGDRLMSAYRSGGERFWILTEADRSVTTILLPEDY